MMDVKQIELRLSRATTLPIMPGIVSQVLAMTDNPDYGARHYEQVILQDAALAAKILRTANSPVFGGNGRITCLNRALSQLGLNTLRSVCMTVAFQSALHNKSINKRFDAVYFWQHSLAVACASKVLACLKRHPQPEEAFLAGLLHDLGKLALCMFLSEEANRVFDRMQQQNLSQVDAEGECLGITHQEIGRMAAACWSLPEIYIEPISKHHTPTEDIYEINALTAFVHVGNLLAHEIDRGASAPGAPQDADPLLLDYLAIPEAQYQPLRQAVAHEVSRVSELQGLV
jgi:HD-like signal output (HDOD) protein